jgi:hypothetical protein
MMTRPWRLADAAVLTGCSTAPRGGLAMKKTDSSHQTVRIRHGRHVSPAQGACVVELASMLAGEPFSDHPETVCPVIAAFLRGYNDRLPAGELGELYPYAALVVGTAASASVRRQRAHRLLEWADARRPRRGSLLLRLVPWDPTVVPAVEAAVRIDREHRPTEVARLLYELVAIGRYPEGHAGSRTPEQRNSVRGDVRENARPTMRS